MWNSIENLKQNLSKIALDVHNDDDEEEELGIYGSGNGDEASVSDRRSSHGFAHSKSVSHSSLPNGTDELYSVEIEQYKAEIKRLQESEAEIKALSVNYAAILKEKEDQIYKLNQENGSLKQNLDATRDALASRNENMRASTNNLNVLKGSGDQSPKRLHRSTSQTKSRYSGNQLQNGGLSRQDGEGNGIMHAVQSDETKNLSSWKEKELADLLEKNRSLDAIQTTHELQLNNLQIELEKERNKVMSMQLKLQEEQDSNNALREELRKLKSDMHKTSLEMSKLHSEINDKTSELRSLQMDLSIQKGQDADENVKSLKKEIATLIQENTSLKMTKDELESALEKTRTSSKELAVQKLEADLKETLRERDKAVQQLTRLKQHLLEKEFEESEKMDEDSKIIEELRENNEYQKAQIVHLEKALKQAIASQEEARMSNNNELQRSKEIIEDLNQKLTKYTSLIEAKDVELSNLQTALGQYFAEIEAKEHLEQQLTLAREESTKLAQLLKDAEKDMQASKREKEEIMANLSHTERVLGEGKMRMNKLEEDNAKLRRALEQSMTRLNRMSVDSDYLVDRRIVIKLLVTYFQRNHSKEVLDLMVRMLGFSDEEKKRIGVAQQGGKGVVRGVLGLPGRLVGGILGGNSSDAAASAALDNQSFADMWVDFLLKETEEREKREAVEDAGKPKEDTRQISNAAGVASSSGTSAASYLSPSQSYNNQPSQGNLPQFAQSHSEFSTVPLNTLDSTSSRVSRLFAKQ